MTQAQASGRYRNTASGMAQEAAASPVVTVLARAGYAAKGLVYIIIGALAAKAAIGDGGATTDRKGAIMAIYQQPFGKLLLTIVAIGLICFALWSLFDAAADLERKGTKPKAIAVRLSYVGVAISYALLAFAALKLVMGSGNTGKSSDTSTQDWTAELLKQPFGVGLVVIVGLAVIAYGGYQLYKAYKASFQKNLNLSGASSRVKDVVIGLGRLGYAARGIVFAIIGLFLVIAALKHDQQQAKGLGGALQELAQQPFGPLLLLIVALGLIAFGFYSLAEARFRKAIERRGR